MLLSVLLAPRTGVARTADAGTVTVASSLGVQERPVVTGGLQLAGRSQQSRMTVTDRSERSTQVLVGRADMRGLQVAVGQRMLTTPGQDSAPPALRVLLSEGSALGPQSLLAVLPLAALVIVVLRVVVGLFDARHLLPGPAVVRRHPGPASASAWPSPRRCWRSGRCGTSTAR